jgi:DNA-binding MarR family transcriptional regulator
LLKKKLIDRRENKSDRRQRDILINAAGLELLEKIDANESNYSALQIPLSSHEVATMNELLDKMRSNPSED